MNIQFDETRPIYEQIIDYIKKKIVRGDYSPGDKLPSQRGLARQLEVNPNTIQRAYREMENTELIETRRGRGTFIKNSNKIINRINEEMADEAISKFLDEMLSLGFSEAEIVDRIEVRLRKEEKNV